MVSIPFPLSSSPGRTAQEGAGRLFNCYAEPLGKDVQAQKGYPVDGVVWRRTPGLTAFGTSADNGCRGLIEVNGTLYHAQSGTLYKTTSAGGASTSVGVLSGTKKVYFARNNAATPDQMVVTENGAFTFTSGAVSAYGPVGFKSPNSVTFLDGFFITSVGDGTLQASGLNATTFNTLDVTKAEAKPDGLTRAVAHAGQLFAFGPLSTEVYNNTANPVGFPFTRSFVMSRGLLNGAAAAGQEDGFGSALIWVADDNTVVRHNGTTKPDKISPPDLDRSIQQLADKTTLEASVYVADGHSKWVLSSSLWTWEFDINTEKWNERDSYNVLRWQASQSVYAFGKWIVGQTSGSSLLYIDQLNYTEAGQPMRYRLESGAVQKFPQRMRVGEAYFNLSTGVGLVTGATNAIDPQMQISWSDDGGISFGSPILRSMGKIGETVTRVNVNRAGMTKRYGRCWRIDVTDPVYVGIMGGDQLTELRAA